MLAPEPPPYPSALDRAHRQRQLKDHNRSRPLGPPVPPNPVAAPTGIGICCSGGGIRSAAYNLGALQELSEHGILPRADYLAAVSGGAYVAAAYASVIRHSDPELLREQPAFAPTSPEESFLRNRCSYLADGMAGKLRLLTAILLGVLANLVFFGLVLYAVGRPLGWFYGWWQPGLAHVTKSRGTFYPSPYVRGLGPFWLAAGAAATLGTAVALFHRMFHPPWRCKRFLNWCAAILVLIGGLIALLFVVLPELLVTVRSVLGGRAAIMPMGVVPGRTAGMAGAKGQSNLLLASAGGLVATLGVTLNEIRQHISNLSTLDVDLAASTSWYKSLSASLRRLVVDVAGYLIGPLVALTGVCLVLNSAAGRPWPRQAEVAAWVGAVLVAGLVLRYADLTSWSMHPFYKERLSSAFFLKRTRDGDGHTVAVAIDYGEALPVSDFARDRMQTPFPELLICAAANISDTGVTPPGVRVDSFVFSPTWIGGPVVGALPTTDYQDAIGKRRQLDATLPAAVAMSGAAVSPAMGKMTRGSLRFLLALGNVRLGVWMPNPRRLPKGLKWPSNPRPRYIFNEIVGRHLISSNYLYITDGGHYDDLGLVELLRRKCTNIICLDAAGGPVDQYSTLGQAMATARAELGVDISIAPGELRPLAAGLAPKHHVIGEITYRDGSLGSLVYIKAAVTSTDPWDVRAYAESDPKFPGDPALEQFYTGPRFDAYRNLGASSTRAALLDPCNAGLLIAACPVRTDGTTAEHRGAAAAAPAGTREVAVV